MEERIQKVFRDFFEDPKLQVNDSTTADDITMWDSLTHLGLIAALEKEFGISFSFKEVMAFKNVGDLGRSISSKIDGDSSKG